MQRASKIILPKSGSYEVFRHEATEVPSPKPDEVLIKVHFSGINFADVLMRQGLYPEAPAYPFTPGYEVSGEVMAVGEGTSGFSVGDKVLAGSYFGGYASHIALPARQVRHLPEKLSLEEGAALPVSFITAYLSLFELGGVKDGDHILIDCLTGSLGSICRELVKDMGVKITGLTTSPEKVETYKHQGIELMTWEMFQKDQRQFDFILNSWGGSSIKECYKKLAPLGHLCCIGASSAVTPGPRSLLTAAKAFIGMPRFFAPNLMNDCRGVSGLNVLRLFEDRAIDHALTALAGSDINVSVDKIFPAADIGSAQKYIQDRKAFGKVLLKWDH